MAQYLILIYENEAAFSSRTDERRKEGYWGAYRAYTKALQAAGVMVGGAGLQPPLLRLTRVRSASNAREISDQYASSPASSAAGRAPRPLQFAAAHIARANCSSDHCPSCTRSRSLVS